MKIGGPGSKLPADAVGAPDEPAGAEGAGKAFAEQKTDPATRAVRAPEPGPTAGAGLVADIAADLGAGRISPQLAIERVIDRVVDRQVGSNAPPAVREAVGAALRQALEDDPLLAEKLRALHAG